ncbi:MULTISPECIES: lanthionine synthetase C family protein [unclassified Frankia]|uniref:lanthionine synthetase C family protein n=1 Tax=unclassified Frankia TaxID=2632575 RepID=UPI002AD2F4BE|nr:MULTISPECIES: lanthionine synthetase C family protein [unclassified Frankia]
MISASEMALMVGHRLQPAASVTSAVPLRSQASLAHGLAGTALLHARLSVAEPVFTAYAAEHWATAADLLKGARSTGPGVFGDRGGLAASLIIGSTLLPDPSRHLPAAARATQWLSGGALELAQAKGTSTWAFYDVINGLAGIGRVLLTAHTSGQTVGEPGLLAALHALTHLLTPGPGTRPRWWIPADRHPPTAAIHPSGAATTGMAHGVAGPLAFLAVAHATGHTVPGQTTAIRYAAEWLITWRIPGSHRWPPTITGDQLDGRTTPLTPGRTDAWCYGTPGIGRALTLAGHALTDPAITATGIAATCSLTDRPPCQWDTEGLALCHGTSGVLQSAFTTSPATTKSAADCIATTFDKDRPFGFTDQPGLLTGAAGTALALADHDQIPTTTAARWDSILLLS